MLSKSQTWHWKKRSTPYSKTCIEKSKIWSTPDLDSYIEKSQIWSTPDFEIFKAKLRITQDFDSFKGEIWIVLIIFYFLIKYKKWIQSIFSFINKLQNLHWKKTGTPYLEICIEKSELWITPDFDLYIEKRKIWSTPNLDFHIEKSWISWFRNLHRKK